jgi:hypothetical protein
MPVSALVRHIHLDGAPNRNDAKSPKHQQLPTPVNVYRLEKLLKGYDTQRATFLIKGFTEGFRIPATVEWPSVESNNHLSAYRQTKQIDDDLQTELTSGRIAGPFETQPLDNFFVSPIGMVPKKEPGAFRRIHDLSYPHNRSVNDAIAREQCAVKYETLDHVINWVVHFGSGSFIAKSDIEKAFRILPLHPESYHLMGFKWKNLFYYDKCLPMGCSVSCHFFEEFSSAIQWVLCHHFQMVGITHILDDFMFIADSYEACNKKLNTFLALARYLNIPIKISKTFRPDQIMTVHGVEIDSMLMEIRLPEDKVKKARDQLIQLKRSKKTTLRKLQSIIGLLNFACQVIVPGRPFLRRMITLTCGLSKPHHHVRLNKEAHADIDAWLCFINAFNGRTVLQQQKWISAAKLHMYTDSASSIGYAGILGSQWFMGEWPVDWKSYSIALLELFPIVTAIDLWADSLANKCIIFHTDNMSIVNIINSQTSKDVLIMYLVRRLVVTTILYIIMFRAVHIPGCDNSTADLFS